MPRLLLFLCAEEIIIDRRSNMLSAINVLEQLNFENMPAVWPKMVVASLFEREEGEPEILEPEVRITLAGTEIVKQKIAHNFQGEKRSRNTFIIGGLPIVQPGIINIEISYEGNVLGFFKIDVMAPKSAQVIQEKPVNENSNSSV